MTEQPWRIQVLALREERDEWKTKCETVEHEFGEIQKQLDSAQYQAAENIKYLRGEIARLHGVCDVLEAELATTRGDPWIGPP